MCRDGEGHFPSWSGLADVAHLGMRCRLAGVVRGGEFLELDCYVIVNILRIGFQFKIIKSKKMPDSYSLPHVPKDVTLQNPYFTVRGGGGLGGRASARLRGQTFSHRSGQTFN